MSISEDLLRFANENETNLDLPMFIMVGTESAGKSMFLSALAGKWISFSSVQTGTRCPIVYNLINSTMAANTLGGQLVSENDLPDLLEQHMIQITESSRDMISSEPIYVSISSPQIRESMIIMDLPGISERRKEFAEMTRQLIQDQVIKRPYVVLLAQCGHTAGVTTDLSFLEQIVYGCNIEQEKIIRVINKIDIQLASWQGEGDLNPFFEIEQDVWFTSINWGKWMSDKDDYKTLNNNITKLELVETKNINESIVGRVDERVLRTIGCRKLFKFMTDLMVSARSDWLNKMKKLISTKLNDHNLELNSLLSSSTGLNPEKGKEMITTIITKFVERFIKFMDGNEVSSCGSILSEDLKLSVKEWDCYKKQHTLVNKILDDNELNIYSVIRFHKIHGLAVFTRLNNYFELLIMKNDLNNTPDAQIMAYGMRDGYFDSWKCVTMLMKEQLLALTDGLPWLFSIYESLIEKYLSFISEELLNKNIWHKYRLLLDDCKKNLISYIKKQMEIMKERWTSNIKIYSNYIPMDITNKTLLYLLNSSFENLGDIEVPDEPTDDNKGDKMTNKFTEKVPEAPKSTLKKQQPIATGNKLTFDDDENDKSEGKIANDSEKPRYQNISKVVKTKDIKFAIDKGKALINIRTMMKENKNKFNIIDAVKGGFQRVKTYDMALVSIPSIRNVAIEYYHMMLCRFLFDFDACMSTYINCIFSPNGSTNLTHQLTTMLQTSDVNVYTSDNKEDQNRVKFLENEISKLKKLM
jgi:hypothetical protein